MSLPTPLPRPQAGQNCSCGSGHTYEKCCGAVHADLRAAHTAEQLMRARFTAHVAQDFAFLHRTFEPTARLPYTPEPEVENIGWTKLVVHAHEPGKTPDQAFVEFSASYVDSDREYVLQEKSEFHRVDGQWLYARAVRHGPPPVKAAPKVGRNDPCPCGSGRKYKQCCLR